MWCPICKKDKHEGMETCDVCDSELLEGNIDDYKILFRDEEEDVIYELMEHLQKDKFDDLLVYYNKQSKKTHIYCKAIDYPSARESAIQYITNKFDVEGMRQEAYLESIKDKLPLYDLYINDPSLQDAFQKKTSAAKTFVKSKDKYDDFKSSAVSLIVVGIIGFVVLFLIMSGVINLSFSTSTKYIFYSVMFVMFTLFIAGGVISAIHAVDYKKKISVEDEESNNVVDYLLNEFDPSTITIEEDTSDEEIYFVRIEAIKQALKARFEHYDDAFIDEMIDENYSKIFND